MLSWTGCGLLGHHEKCECHKFFRVRLHTWWAEQYKFQNNEWSHLYVYLNLKDTSSVALWGLELLTRWCTFRVWYCFHYCSLGRRKDFGPAVGLSEGYQTQIVLPSVLEEHYEKIWVNLEYWSHEIPGFIVTSLFSVLKQRGFLSVVSWTQPLAGCSDGLLVKEGKDPDLQSLQNWKTQTWESHL